MRYLCIMCAPVCAREQKFSVRNKIERTLYMEKFISKICWIVVATLAALSLASCNPEPKTTDVEFSYPTFDSNEGEEGAYISVYLMQSPEKFPVVVDMDVEMVDGKGLDADGNQLTLDDVIDFIETDQTYTVNDSSDPRKATITGVEVTYSAYNQKVYFNVKQNDFLQKETIEIKFTITRVEGSNMGNVTETILTIVDDEKAPLVRVGYYDTTYTAPADATRQEKGQFYMRVQKVDKYNYVASELFGLPRPRLLGRYEPTNNTIVFDGTDYDHKLWHEKSKEMAETDENATIFQPINAFQNDTIWANAYNKEGKVTQILKLRGKETTGGGQEIVMTTEAIEENSRGVILSIDTPCGFDIYDYNEANNKVGEKIGTYDAMEKSTSMIFSDTNYEEAETRNLMPQYAPFPFGGWVIE